MLKVKQIKDRWHVMDGDLSISHFPTPAEARFMKRQWFYYMNEDDILRAIEHLWKEMPPKRIMCPCCEQMVFHVRKWRTNTQYVDDSLNYQESCYDCICENDLMRHHDWADYYSSAYGYYNRSEFRPRSRKDYVR